MREEVYYMLHLRDYIVIKVTNEFLDLIQYLREDIVNKHISEVLSLLKATFDIKEIDKEKNYFIFTKDYEAIEVNIELEDNLIMFKVNRGTKLKDKFLFFEELYNENRLGMAIFSVPDIRLLKANQTYLDFFDKPFDIRENTYGKKIHEFVTGWKGSPSEQLWREVLSKKKIIHVDEYAYDNIKRGRTFWKGTLIPIHEDGKMKYVAEMTEEITERYLTEMLIEEQSHIVLEENDELERTLSNQEKFFSFISHEFKTPLTVTMSAVQAIELICKNELSDIAKKYIKKIYQSSLQQVRLVNNLLDITRADAGYLKVNKKNMDIVRMTKLIIKSILVYANEKNVNIECNPSSKEIYLGIDDEKYERILLNLLSNAIKFSPIKGNIYVDIEENDGLVSITVKDEGPGIPEDKQKVIFERFGQVNNSLTRESEGTGIGLYIVNLLVNALGGEIKLESKLGQGSAFKVILPIEIVEEEDILKGNLMDDGLVRTVNVEFSNVYFD
ncbi:sensor histidine kinase [Clostridium intestinale]|uniref:histidine kinase n=1 Tax=Clostridium intestinale URNW TaxID=1294142 RepID=U2NK89_9CLOT|nr:PAS domain-containing sensor histidine kinase [Clostridium intestinale]ERK29291.1 response regulator receiver sensor signal transduction histidine kinase [Clostridium intestinale URNW]